MKLAIMHQAAPGRDPRGSPSSGNAACATEAAAAERHVFVYGTLRRGGANDINRLVPAPRFVGHARLSGTLHHLGAYPGLVLGGTTQVLGEIYAIEAALEPVLDRIEEVYPQNSDEYAKREVPVAVAGRELSCLVYEINPAYVRGRPVVQSGDWLAETGAISNDEMMIPDMKI